MLKNDNCIIYQNDASYNFYASFKYFGEEEEFKIKIKE